MITIYEILLYNTPGWSILQESVEGAKRNVRAVRLPGYTGLSYAPGSQSKSSPDLTGAHPGRLVWAHVSSGFPGLLSAGSLPVEPKGIRLQPRGGGRPFRLPHSGADSRRPPRLCPFLRFTTIPGPALGNSGHLAWGDVLPWGVGRSVDRRSLLCPKEKEVLLDHGRPLYRHGADWAGPGPDRQFHQRGALRKGHRGALGGRLSPGRPPAPPSLAIVQNASWRVWFFSSFCGP